MSKEPEHILEEKLVKQLTNLGYNYVTIKNESDLLENLKEQLEAFNEESYSDQEFSQILNHLSKGNVFDKAKRLRSRFTLKREEEETSYVRFFNDENWDQNTYQVTNQVTVEGTYKNRYDVTILVNGLPLVQIELKRRGLELKEAFNQINRYQRHSFWSNSALFQYIQIFGISNGVNTKYYANNRKQSFKQTFYWADEHSNNITDLESFAEEFLDPSHLGKMISKYIVMNETFKILMVLRPYQYYAVEAIIDQVKTSEKNGYIWHTTGSGKTLTSFKASQIVMNLPETHKVVFVVDRKDLDYQTAKEFNAFKKGCIDMTEDTKNLVDQLTDPDNSLIVTTIQKLNFAIKRQRYKEQISYLQDEKMVFIFDECHRSQFGDTHQRITDFFDDYQLFGFTGTPIFADNAIKNDLGKRTTKDLFDECLHKYVITDAIRDNNVLKFSVEYVGRYKKNSNNFIDINVEDIDRAEVLNSDQRLEKITDYIIAHHDQKTHSKDYTAIFTVSSIDNLITYYDFLKEKKENGEHNLRVATIFSFYPNEEDSDATGELPDHSIAADSGEEFQASHTREKLEEYIDDYNEMFGTNFSTRSSESFENYYKDISKRIKEREKETFNDDNRVDILLVVNMFLTGFDAKKVNTLYVDKNLKHHNLIQAYSRTNRIINDQKSQGNIVCFRNMKENTDEALTLFSNKNAKEEVFIPEYEEIVEEFSKAFSKLLQIAPTVKSVDRLLSEEDELTFVKAFRELIRIHNVLKTFADFSWEDLAMNEQSFEDYKSKYLDLYDKVRTDNQTQKVSILEDVDFELELIHRDEINVAYILKLLAKLKHAEGEDKAKQKKAIMDMMSSEVQLRSKRELIEKFIDEHLPKIDDADAIYDEFQQYWQDQKVLELNRICKEEDLDRKQFKNLIDTYVFTGKKPLTDDVIKCLEERPSVLQARQIGKRIIGKMEKFVSTFVDDMAA